MKSIFCEPVINLISGGHNPSCIRKLANIFKNTNIMVLVLGRINHLDLQSIVLNVNGEIRDILN